jgi:hypothetical protein
MHFPTDREALAAAMQTLGHADANAAKVIWIKNTLSCQTLLASQAYLDEARARDDLVALSEPKPLAFDPAGDLVSEF